MQNCRTYGMCRVLCSCAVITLQPLYIHMLTDKMLHWEIRRTFTCLDILEGRVYRALVHTWYTWIYFMQESMRARTVNYFSFHLTPKKIQKSKDTLGGLTHLSPPPPPQENENIRGAPQRRLRIPAFDFVNAAPRRFSETESLRFAVSQARCP